MDKYELSDLIDEAQEKMMEAVELLKMYIRETNDQNAKIYIVDHLEIMTYREHGFISSDLNLDDLKDRIFGDEEE